MTSLLHRRIESWTSPYRAYRERRKSSRVAPAQTKIEGVDFVDHSKTQSQVKTEEISVASSRSFPAATHSKPSPTTQRALVVASKGTYALLDTYPVPRLLHEKEVIIKSCAVGLNAIDWKSVDYNFCLPEFPWITGREMAGVVEKVGDEVTDFKVGDKVWTSTYYRDRRAGCFQDLVTVPQHTVSHIPENLTFEQAACLGVGALTAAMTLWKWLDVPMPTEKAQLAKDQEEYLLVWGGSAVTGQFAIQFATQANLHVIAVTSSKTSGLVRNLGAIVVERDNKSNDEIVAEVRAIGGDNITRAVDLVGHATAVSSLSALSMTKPAVFAPLALMKEQTVPANVTVHTVEMKRFVLDEEAGVFADQLSHLVGKGHIQLPDIEVLHGGLAVVEEGLERLKKGDMNGKKFVVSMA